MAHVKSSGAFVALTVVGITAAISLFACVGSGNGSGVGASPDGAPAAAPASDGGAGGAGAGSTALSCGAVFDCAALCAETDEPCQDACLAKGSPSAQTAATAIVTCATQNNCQDAACLQANCIDQIKACVQTTSPAGKPLDGTAPAGNVPADLVGNWGGFDEHYEFHADGTFARSFRVKAATCVTDSLEYGTATADGSTLTLFLTSGKITACGAVDDTPYTPTTEAYRYTFTNDGHVVLRLERQGCEPGGNCVNGYDKR